MKTTSTRHFQHSFATCTWSALVLLTLVFSGCGGGGSAPSAVNGVVAPSTTPPAANSFTITSDSYGMVSPNYLAASTSTLGVVLRSALATSMTDPDFKTVSRIDIPAGFTPSGTYALGGNPQGLPAFPGTVYFFNGHPYTLLSTVGGTITFSAFGANSGDRITGSFNATVSDGADSSTPRPTYSIAESFDFAAQSAGAVLPAPVAASAAAASYDANCASCHALGNYDSTSAGASNLALKGGRMNGLFTPDTVSHQGLRLDAGQISALKVFLNAN
jgi:hypothetical protein